MRSPPVVLLLCGLLASCLPLGAASPAYVVDSNQDGSPDQWYEMEGSQILRASQDRNYDGRVDYLVEYDREGRKIREEMDFNFDGLMDDFYYFDKGALIRQEIDSNFDQRIDIWVFLEGIYIRRYEMDRDFDGRAEVIKDYGQ